MFEWPALYKRHGHLLFAIPGETFSKSFRYLVSQSQLVSFVGCGGRVELFRDDGKNQGVESGLFGSLNFFEKNDKSIKS